MKIVISLHLSFTQDVKNETLEKYLNLTIWRNLIKLYLQDGALAWDSVRYFRNEERCTKVEIEEYTFEGYHFGGLRMTPDMYDKVEDDEKKLNEKKPTESSKSKKRQEDKIIDEL